MRLWRVLMLVLVAAYLAFVDGRHVSTILFPGVVWQVLVRPALLIGGVLCLSALYAEGALPAGPWGRTRWRTGILAALLCASALGLLYSLLPQRPIDILATAGAVDGSLTYPDAANGSEIVAVIAAVVPSLAFLAALVLAIFAPACVMRFGWRGSIGQSWRAFRRHWASIGLRIFALVPIAIVSLPIMSYWWVENWSFGSGTPPVQSNRVQFAIAMCNKVGGPDVIAYSAFVGTALLGLFLWWIGRSTGVLLDRRD